MAARHLVGREEELGAIIGLLDAGEQLTRVALLSGEAGIGKTTVWLAGIDAAAPRGYRVLSSRPSEAETKFSFVGLTDLLDDAAAEVLAELPPIQRRALEAALLLGESEIHADDRSIAAAFLGALRLLSANGPFALRSTTSSGWMRPRSRRFATPSPDSSVSRSPPCWRSAVRCRRGFAVPFPRNGCERLRSTA
jgi:hypothetical protein